MIITDLLDPRYSLLCLPLTRHVERLVLFLEKKSREVNGNNSKRIYDLHEVLLGDIEEIPEEKNTTAHNSRIFSNMSYELHRKNIVGSTIPLDSLAKYF